MLHKIYGIIASGKSTITKKLAEETNGKLWVERFKENPFQGLYYQAMHDNEDENYNPYSMPLQLMYFQLYFEQNEKIMRTIDNIHIQDGGVYSGLAFCKTQYKQGMMTKDQYKFIHNVFKTMREELDINSNIYYLDINPETAHQRMLMRCEEEDDRELELKIPLEYLTLLDDSYREVFDELKLDVTFVNVDPMSKKESISFFKKEIEYWEQKNKENS